MLKVGVTGGIGSGKSTVCGIFRTLGIPVYDADLETKQLYLHSTELKEQLIATFGADVYLPDGSLNREKLRAIVFHQPDSGNRLNSIVHPFVFAHFDQWCDRQTAVPYVVKEAAIMFESGGYRQMDYIIGVTAPDEVRIQRVMQRDHISREEVIQRISRQMPTEELRKRCDFIISNSGEESLINQVMEIHRKLLTIKK